MHMLAISERDHVTVVKWNLVSTFDTRDDADKEDLRAIVKDAYDLIMGNQGEVVDVKANVVITKKA